MPTKSSNKKSTTTTTKSTTKTSSSSKNTTTVWSLNKISFYTIVAVAVLYLISMVLSLIGVNSALIGALQGFATAIMVGVVTILAWRYVDGKPTVWKVLYIVCLLVVLFGIIIPLI